MSISFSLFDAPSHHGRIKRENRTSCNGHHYTHKMITTKRTVYIVIFAPLHAYMHSQDTNERVAIIFMECERIK